MSARPVWALAAGFAALGLVAVATDAYLHDEGVLAHAFARWVAIDPWHAFFLQKSRPPIAAFYAPIALLGLRAYLVAHVLVAALGIVALAGVARALGQSRPWIVALVLAASPLYLGAAAAGVSNSDGVAVAAIAGWCWLGAKRPLGAGVLFGMLPWIRAELAPLVLATVVVALVQRDRRVVMGVLLFPCVYALAGALVHADPLWFLHWPPALPEPMPDNPYWRTHTGVVSASDLAGTALALTPMLVLAVLAPLARLRGLELAWALFAAFELGLLLAMPRWRAFNFDLSPRYLLGVLPVVALAIGRAVETWDEHDAPWTRVGGEALVLAGFGALAFVAARAGSHPNALVATAAAAAAIACVRANRPRWAIATCVVVLALGPFAFADDVGLRRERESPEIDETLARLREREDWRARPIYTNSPLLPIVLARSDAPATGAVHYLVQADQLYELVRLSDPDNGQRAALLEHLRAGFGSPAILPGDLAPDDVPDDALFVLVDDPRLELVLPSERWEPVLEPLVAGERVRISAVRPEVDR
ncbi:MAG TPA: hypothetical protein VFG69_18250 [Nannocystaceae bacterium]|nr:hypothetical protein [Nannocystaceae bacterium]